MTDKVKKTLAILAIAFFAGAGTGIAGYLKLENDFRRQFEEITAYYIVQPGDNFCNIVARYRNMDARNPYVLRFQDEIMRLNPELEAKHYQLQPGDMIKIRYYVEKGE